MYGKSANIDLNESHTDKGALIEYAELLDERISQPLETTINGNNNSNSSKNNIDFDVEMKSVSKAPVSKPTLSPQAATPTKAIHKQIETKMADGKRRITPMFIPLGQDS